ncbi:disulfide oxidoreductase YuzD [Evansella vedderi]|uniref:Disulfide oxidoreductase YuzD n=1 Tax=Evansella vedderi TaxID=38282 RepID=A0ABU0A2C4_9BACI|nr:YuzD family protein [Evansella vedderi]MDQ0257642.1 disulfide oxidoreductase YuzD [Evansella vedderi]
MSIKITVYGAEEKCASCIHLPTAIETKEWLEAAISRKFPDRSIEFVYCDIEQPNSEEEKMFSEKILEDEYFYPLVVLNGKVVGEGNPKLTTIYQAIEEEDA